MIRLGNILYSNCYPVHAQLLEPGEPAVDLEIVDGTPAELNRALAAGSIDVAPCSSIEFARHADRYRVLPGPAIASDGPVRSILLETSVPPTELGGRLVAVPSASATSVVLLRILLEMRAGVRPEYRWFDQSETADPIVDGAAAALRIGDVALRREPPAGRQVIDLGEAWKQWTGLPFVFAVWQTRLGPGRDAELQRLAAALDASLDWFEQRIDALASRHARRFGLPPADLAAYWRSLRYRLDGPATSGLLHFYACAASLGEAPAVTGLVRVPAAT